MEVGTGENTTVVLIENPTSAFLSNHHKQIVLANNTFKVFLEKKEMENVKERGNL